MAIVNSLLCCANLLHHTQLVEDLKAEVTMPEEMKAAGPLCICLLADCDCDTGYSSVAPVLGAA